MKKNTAYIIIIAISGIALALHAWSYFPFIADDALISLRYAQRFLEGQGLTWTDGHRVEGYSNLLWILVLSAAGSLGVDLIDAARGLGLAFMIGTPAIMWFIVPEGPSLRDRVSAWTIGALWFAGTVSIAVWAIGGLEQPLLALLLAIVLVSAAGYFEQGVHRWPLSLSLALLCLTRPDGVVFSGAIFIAGLFPGPGQAFVSRLGNAVRISLPSIIAVLAQLAFRLLYYGDVVPNTARIKVAFTKARVITGIEYMMNGLVTLLPLVLLSLVAVVILWRGRTHRRTLISFIIIGAVWAGYITLVGGDIFPATRHFVPIVVVMAVLLILGIDAVFKSSSLQSARMKWLLSAVLLAAIVPYLYWQGMFFSSKVARIERWEWDGKVLALSLKHAFAEKQPLIAVTAAGCIPYWTEFPAVDMLGLNDRYLARTRPPHFGKGYSGHEISDWNYVLARKPDLIVFFSGMFDPLHGYVNDASAIREFRNLYSPVYIAGSDPHTFRGWVWFRKQSIRIGIRNEDDELIIPAVFLKGNHDAVARNGAKGQYYVNVSNGDSLHISLPATAQRFVKAILPDPVSVSLRSSVERSGDSLRLGFVVTSKGSGRLYSVRVQQAVSLISHMDTASISIPER